VSRYRKARRRFGKRVPPKAEEVASREGAVGRAKGSGGLRQGIAILVAVAILIPIVVFTFLNFYQSDEPDQQSPAPTVAGSAGQPKAAIADQLSLTQPNPTFVETATAVLEQAGYAVDYYPGEEVTVEFYRNLPLHDYGLIILRVHSGLGAETGFVSLFTSEPYTETKYVDEQKAGRFGRARYYEGGETYFGINPEFIEKSMNGRFDRTVVVMMGCWGLIWTDMAEAFVERGARTVLSWDGLVSASHTDAATERLLHHLLIDRATIQAAVVQTMAEIGPDPSYGSILQFYP
jgi:hypothetical protein